MQPAETTIVSGIRSSTRPISIKSLESLIFQRRPKHHLVPVKPHRVRWNSVKPSKAYHSDKRRKLMISPLRQESYPQSAVVSGRHLAPNIKHNPPNHPNRPGSPIAVPPTSPPPPTQYPRTIKSKIHAERCAVMKSFRIDSVPGGVKVLRSPSTGSFLSSDFRSLYTGFKWCRAQYSFPGLRGTTFFRFVLVWLNNRVRWLHWAVSSFNGLSWVLPGIGVLSRLLGVLCYRQGDPGLGPPFQHGLRQR